MRVLLTGGTGFLGTSIKEALKDYKIDVLGRRGTDIFCDLKSQVPTLVKSYDMVIHAAGKAHIQSRSKIQNDDFFQVNVNGLYHLLLGLEKVGVPKSFVFISSVSVYGTHSGVLIGESHPLKSKDAYGRSKIEAESLISQWCARNGVVCSILRLPLLAGSAPPGNLGAMIDGIARGYYFNIAQGRSRKSMVLADDVAKIIPVVARLGGVYNLTDGFHPSFSELSSLIAKQLGKAGPANIPTWMATIIAKMGDLLGSKAPINSDKLEKITSDLTFDDSKAREMLGWNPTPVLKGFKISE